MAVIWNVNSSWLLHMGPGYRTAESARTNYKFKETPEAYAPPLMIDLLHAYSGWMAAGSEGDVENEDRITKVNTLLQGLFFPHFGPGFARPAAEQRSPRIPTGATGSRGDTCPQLNAAGPRPGWYVPLTARRGAARIRGERPPTTSRAP